MIDIRQLTSEEVYNMRAASGLSQRELADMLLVHIDTVRYWESGKRRMSKQVAYLLAALGIEQLRKNITT